MSIYEYGDGPVSLVVVPGFEVLRRIGVGGFSTVYEAVQEDVRDFVALKVLGVDVGDARGRARFERECKSMGRLRGRRGIVPVYRAAFTSDGRPVIVMAYLPGGSLGDRLAKSGRVPVDEVVTIGCEVAAALAIAHQEGIYHRDIKPENLLIDRDGYVALTDFGIAFVSDLESSSQTDSTLTPPHAPPERFIVNPDGDDPRAGDIYSLASTLYELLAGRPPFGTAAEGGIGALANRVLGESPPQLPRSEVPPHVVDALERALAKRPGDRFESAQEFGAALRGEHQAVTNARTPIGAAPDDSRNNPNATVFRRRTSGPLASTTATGKSALFAEPGVEIGGSGRSATRRVARRPVAVETVPETPATKRKSGLWIAVFGLALGIALAMVGLVIHASTGGRTTTTTLPTPSATAAPGVLALKAPIVESVTASPSGTAITFTWSDPNPPGAASLPAVLYTIDKNGSPGDPTSMPEDGSGTLRTRVLVTERTFGDNASEAINTATGRYCVRVVFAGIPDSLDAAAPERSSSSVCVGSRSVN